MSGRYTLSTFYKSREWGKLLSVIRTEWINEQGEIICAYCGKPIVKKYDCIGHHKIPLTEDNVNDVSISLNPENIDLLHHRCHNKIHNKLGYTDKRVYLVWGSPLAGKSSWVKQAAGEGDLIVDMDAIWQCVSGCDKYQKPGRLKSVVFGVRDTLIEMIRYRRGKWLNAYIIGGYPFSGERERMLDTLRRLKSVVFGVRDTLIEMIRYRRGKWLNAYIIGGYPFSGERERMLDTLNAESIFIDTSESECRQRLEECNDGRNKEEWEEYISDWWEKFSPIAPHSLDS